MSPLRFATSLLIVLVTAAITPAPGAHAAGSAFTYQGRLDQSGSAANGSFAMSFSLLSAASGGSQISATIDKNGVAVAGGLFTVELDFGAGAFDNTDRWLQIDVDGTTLTPRQPITRAPYSIQTRGIFVNSAETFVGVGRKIAINSAEAFGVHSGVATPTGFGGMYVSTAGQQSRPFYGYSAGGLPDMWHYYDGDTAKWHLVNGNIRLTVESNGDVGIGTDSPQTPLHVKSGLSDVPGVIFGEQTTISSLVPAVLGQSNAIYGTGVRGEALATADNNAGVDGVSHGLNGVGVRGRALSTNGTNYGVIGYAQSPTGYDFFASGAGVNYGAPSSIRWKRNIEPIEKPLDMLARIRGVYFDWDEEHGSKHDIGMVAEEVGKVLPEIVQYEKNGIDATGMDYGMITPLLVEAIKELRLEHQTRIDSLRAEKDARIERLISENREQALEIDDLRTRLEALESLAARLAAESR